MAMMLALTFLLLGQKYLDIANDKSEKVPINWTGLKT